MHANSKVTPLARLTGMLWLSKPYINHINVPKENKAYMPKDIPEVFFVRIVCTACGIKDAVVHAAATSPQIVIKLM